MSSLTGVSYSTTNRAELWYLWTAFAANEAVTATWSGSTRSACSFASYTGVANSGASSFEQTNTANNSGSSPQTTLVNVAAGTTGRMDVCGAGVMDNANGTGSITLAPANSETQRGTTQALAGAAGASQSVSSEFEEYSSSASHDCETTATKTGRTLNWAVIGTALLPGVIPYHRLWYSSLSGTDFGATGWGTINEASGTVDNSWNVGLVNNAYYWLVWQWNSTVSGPSYTSGTAGSGIYLAQAFGTLLSTWSGGTLTAENWSMYLTYSTSTTYSATVTDSGSGSETVVKSVTAARANSDSGSGSENVSKSQVLSRVPSDSGSGSIAVGVAQALSRLVPDQGAGQEMLSRLFAGNRTEQDAGSGQVSVSAQNLFQRSFTDLGSGITSLLSTLGIVRAPATELGTGLESVNAQQTLSRTNLDSGSGNTTLTAQQVLGRTMLDAGTGLENLLKQLSGQKAVTDSGTGQETLTKLFAGSRIEQDTGSGQVSVSAQNLFQRSFTDLGSGITSLLSTLGIVRAPATELGTGLESVKAQQTLNRANTISGSGTETLTAQQILSRTVLDSGAGFENLLRTLSGQSTISDSGAGQETLNRLFAAQRTLQATGSGTETNSIQQVLQRGVTDLGSGLESLTASLASAGSIIANLFDQGSGQETVTRLVTYNRGLFDLGSLLESLFSIFTPHTVLPPATGSQGVVIPPLGSSVLVGAIFPHPEYFILPSAQVSADVTILNAQAAPITVTLHYYLTNDAGVKIFETTHIGCWKWESDFHSLLHGHSTWNLQDHD